MSSGIDACILKYLRENFTVYINAVRFCPDPVAQQVTSLMYYAAEVHFQALNSWYTPPRLLGSNLVENILRFRSSSLAVLQSFTDLRRELMEFHLERDSAVLSVLRRKSADGLAALGLQEIPGILSAIENSK